MEPWYRPRNLPAQSVVKQPGWHSSSTPRPVALKRRSGPSACKSEMQLVGGQGGTARIGCFLLSSESGVSATPVRRFVNRSMRNLAQRPLLGRLTPPVNNGFTLQRRTRDFFCFFSGGFGACPYLLNTGEEQIAAM